MRVVISGIGTGGHYYPALVVAREFMYRHIQVVFLARRGKREDVLARQYGVPVLCIDPQGFYGTSLRSKIVSIISIMLSILAVNCVSKRVIGLSFGGYGSLPLIVSCMINRCPFYLFEPNRISGRATTLFAGKAHGIFLGLPLAKSVPGKNRITGIPIREEFKNDRAPAVEKNKLKRILILGGSQGARRLNDLAIKLQSILTKDFRITIISGPRDYQRVHKLCEGTTRVIAFTDTPWIDIANADVIISRSGALAGYELMTSGKPVIFIPFPYAIDDHQYYNAEYFSRIGNAKVLREDEVDEYTLRDAIHRMIDMKIRKSTLILDAEKRIVEAIIKENNL